MAACTPSSYRALILRLLSCRFFAQHTSFLWELNPAKLARYLQIPSKAPAYRAGRSHADFLCALKAEFPSPLLRQFGDHSVDVAFEHAVVERLRMWFSIQHVALAEVLPVLNQPHDQFTKVLDVAGLLSSAATARSLVNN